MSWKAELAVAIGARVVSAEPVSGGDINDAYRVRLDDKRTVFVKTHAQPPAGMFDAEAAGLAWLHGPLRVPTVIASGETFLALEWLDIGTKARDFDAVLGRGLAALHRIGAPAFGLDRDNYLATLPQDNTPARDVVELWVERRLRPLAARAHLGIDAQLDVLREKRDRFGPAEPPAHLHGDLWWGNVIAVDGAPVIIDPAVYGGHREVDLAMLALFGGLPEALVAAYDEAFPLAAGWRDRIALWQLYPLAAHACLFGGGYGAQVTRSLAALI
ncbi:MAG: fructosamine kinase family protein [Myxococcota bacterium]|nr:fructosamine kinase family protein [Myxococcota bacterium]